MSSSTPDSKIHSRARRTLVSTVVSHGNSGPVKTNSKSTTLRRSIQKAFVGCGILSLLVEFMLLRASLVYYKGNDASTAPLELKLPTLNPQQPGPPDGVFNGYPVYYRNVSSISAHTKPYTIQNCLGENFQPDSWMRRSCHFKFFCFNMTNRKFQIYQRQDDRNILPWSDQIPMMDLSESLLSNATPGVSLGGINLKWRKVGIWRLKWFPEVMVDPPTEFYALPKEVVLIPFHSLGGWNPGHAVWDDFLPIFTLTQLFQQPHNNIMALGYHLEDGEGLWASCEAPARVEDCRRLQNKFWPLFNNRSQPTTQRDVILEVPSPKTDLVCAKNGLAGIGDLTDHGTQKLHGWHEEDYQTTHNHGRGGTFWNFRTFCLENLGLVTDSKILQQTPYRVVISIQSSGNTARSLNFAEQLAYLSQNLPNEEVAVSTVILKEMTLIEQVQLATETNVFITGCGGGAVTATFLQKGATAIIYYDEDGGQKQNAATHLPARLDWDLFNHLSYLHVHWFPTKTMKKSQDLELLLTVIRDALDRQKVGSWT